MVTEGGGGPSTLPIQTPPHLSPEDICSIAQLIKDQAVGSQDAMDEEKPQREEDF